MTESTFDKKVKELKADIASYNKTMEAKNQKGLFEAIKEARFNLGLTDPKMQPIEPPAEFVYSLEAAVEKRRRELGLVNR